MEKRQIDIFGIFFSVFLLSVALIFQDSVPKDPNNVSYILYYSILDILILSGIVFAFLCMSGSIRKFMTAPEKPLHIGLTAGLLAGIIGGFGYATTCPDTGCNISEIFIIKYTRILLISTSLGIAFSTVFTVIDHLVRGRVDQRVYLPAIIIFAFVFALLGVLAAAFLDDLGNLVLQTTGIAIVGSGTCESVASTRDDCFVKLGNIGFLSISLIVGLYVLFYSYFRFFMRRSIVDIFVILLICVVGISGSLLMEELNLAGPLDADRNPIIGDHVGILAFVTPWIVLACLFYWLSSKWDRARQNRYTPQ